jgi:hypothetical protein
MAEEVEVVWTLSGSAATKTHLVRGVNGGGPLQRWPEGTVVEAPDGSKKTLRGGKWLAE